MNVRQDSPNEPVDRNTVPDELEFIEGAQAAIQRAIDSLHAQGIPTVHRIDGKLVTVMPDGSQHPTPPVSESDV